MCHAEDRHTSLRGDNMASFSSNVDIHFCLSGWVPDELVSLSLEQIICIFKCLVHQGAFSVTERQEKHAWGSSKSIRTGQMLRMCMEDGIHHHYLNSLSPSPNFHSSLCQLFVRKCTQDAFHCVLWHSPPHTGMVSARTTHATVVSLLSAC